MGRLTISLPRSVMTGFGIVCLLAACDLYLPTVASPYDLGPEVRVSTPSSQFEKEPSVATFEDKAVAVWARPVVGRGVGWGYSNDGGLTWTFGGELPFTPSLEFVDIMPSIAADAAGNFYVAALLDQRNGLSTVAVWRGSFQGEVLTWQPRVHALPLVEEAYTQLPWDAPRICCDPAGNVYLTSTRVHGLTVDLFEQTICFTRSIDNGATWSTPLALSSPMCNGARPVVGPDGEVYVIWHDIAQEQILGRRSVDFGQTFEAAFVVGDIHENLAAGPPGFEPHSRKHPVYPCMSDFPLTSPSVAVDRSKGARRGTLYVSWAEATSGAVSPGTNLISEQESNNYFASAQQITLGNDVFGSVMGSDFSPDHTSNYDIYSFEATAGTTLWIRMTLTGTSPPPFPGRPERCQVFELMCGADTTVSLARARMIEGPMPPVIFTAPRTGRYYVRTYPATSWNYGYVMELRTLLNSASVAQDHRDIILVSSSDSGETWSGKVRVNNDEPMFDNSHPELLVDGAGMVHAAWYDRRDDLSCGAAANTYWTASGNGGASFPPATRVSSLTSSWQFNVPSTLRIHSNIGDYLALAASGGNVCIYWTQRGAPDVDIYSRVLMPMPVPIVGVGSLNASSSPRGIKISWEVKDATNLAALRVLRRSHDSGFEPITSFEVATLGSHWYLDETATDDVTYTYMLEVLLRNGSVERFGSVTIQNVGVRRLELSALSANPFRDRIHILASTASHEPINFHIYDFFGRVVYEAILPVSGGRADLVWIPDAASETSPKQGGGLPNGVYFVHATQGLAVAVQKLVRIR